MRKKIFLAAFMGIVVLLWVAIMQPAEKFEQTFNEIEEAMGFVFLDELDQHKVQKPNVASHQPKYNKDSHVETLKKANAGHLTEQIRASVVALNMYDKNTQDNRQNAIKWYLKAVQNPALKSQKGMNKDLRKLEITLFERIIKANGLAPIPELVRDHTGQVKGYKHKLENHAESLFFRGATHYSLNARAMHSYLFTQSFNKNSKNKIAREYALKWLHNLAEMGSRGHQQRLADLYKKGLFLKKDVEKSKFWQQRADQNIKRGYFDPGVDIIDLYTK